MSIVAPVSIPARPTRYQGILMRSRLEADFAQRFLDVRFRGCWGYEPLCFASPTGQYLPDFRVTAEWGTAYFEVKPIGLFPDGADQEEQVDEWLERLSIIWAPGNDPGAILYFVAWQYGGTTKDALMIEGTGGDGRGRIWRCNRPGSSSDDLWQGMDQRSNLLKWHEWVTLCAEGAAR